MIVDLVLLALMAGGFVVGYVRGAVRQLLSLGVWLVALVVAANMRPFLTEWLSRQWFQYSRPYVGMLSYLIVFVVLLVVGLAVVHLTGSRTNLTRREWIDDVLGGVVGVIVVVMVAAGFYVILATIYAQGGIGTGEDVALLRNTYNGLRESAILTQVRAAVLPVLSILLGPVLPSDVTPVMR